MTRIDNHSYIPIRSCIKKILMSVKVPPKLKQNSMGHDSIYIIEESDIAILLINLLTKNATLVLVES